MGLPVVTVASGGLPVVDVTATLKLGTPVTEAANGYGVPVTKVTGKPGMPVVFETIGVAPGVPVLTTFATFNGTPSAGVVMSNGNLTATHGSTNSNMGVASLSLLTTGKFYFEVKVITSTTLQNFIGILLSTGTFIDMGNLRNCFEVGNGTSSIIYANDVTTGKNLGTTAVNDVFGFAVDMTARLGWIRRNSGLWNATAGADPATAVGGIAFASGSFAPAIRFSSGAATDAFTGNFGQSAFAFTPPSNFSLGWGT